MNKKIFVFLILLLIVSFSTTVFASLTFTTNAITGTTASSIDLGSGNTLSLNTTNNAPIITGTGLVTLGGALNIAGNVGIGTTDTSEGKINVVPGSGYNAAYYSGGGSGDTVYGFYSENSGPGTVYGGYYNPYGGTTNYGVYANPVSGDVGTATNYGVYSRPNVIGGGSVTNYAFYGKPQSGTTNWGVYITGEDKNYFSGNVGIGTSTPGASSILDISSTTKGVVLPRMTKAQRDAIASKVAGMAIYQTDAVPGLRVYNGTNWMRFTETAD